MGDLPPPNPRQTPHYVRLILRVADSGGLAKKERTSPDGREESEIPVLK